MSLPPIETLWIGDRLPPVEELGLKSMTAFGHPVTLWTYGPIANAPKGVTVADASEILPRSSIISYRGNPRGTKLFANIFRLELLRRGANLWLDADVLLLKPIDLPDDYIFGWESDRRINNAVLRLPRQSELLTELLAFVSRRPVVCPWWPAWKRSWQRATALIGLERGPETIALGTFGPKAVTHFVKELGLTALAKSRDVFYPVNYAETDLYFRPGGLESRLTENTHAVHLWLANIEPRIAAIGKDFFLSETMLGREFERYGVEINVI
jgi:hypothetical protein